MDHKRELFSSEENTTNNRMELRAVIEGLKALRKSCDVVVVTDSQYVRRGITEWLEQWKANGWRKRKKGKSGTRAVLNQDLWKELERVIQNHSVAWQWVKGHASHRDNIRCDQLALIAARQQVSSKTQHNRPKRVASEGLDTP
jgi:ribonuclease HI